ncbi:MAG TPA: ABC transporter permease [Pyrinomonadaceae bacterium]|jgi:putative ABC transport system permease protein
MRLKLWSRRPRREAELDAELSSHLKMAVRERIERGETPEEAEAAVRREFGNIGLVKEVTREMWGGVWLEQLLQDIRYGLRSMRRAPSFTIVAVLTLGLGIGANTAIFSMVNAILLRQLPFRDPEQLVAVDSKRADPGKHPFTIPDFIDYRDQNQTLEQIAAFANWSASLTGSGEAERVQGMRISANAFRLLGVEALVGRALIPEDDTPGRQDVVVLGHGLWQRRFGANPLVVGQTLTLNSNSYTIVGVLPPQFIFPIQEAELAVPLAPDADPWRSARTSTNFLRAIARLKPGVTLAQAEADLTSIAERLRQQYPVANENKLGVTLTPLGDAVVGSYRHALWMLLGAVGFVLAVASINLASLSLARASTRHREMAIRAALGATRRRLIRQMTTESLLLALSGGLIGLMLAWWGINFLLALSPVGMPRLSEVGLDARVLGFTLAVSLLAGLFFGILPAAKASRVDLNEELKSGGRSGSDGTGRSRVRSVLVIAEIAISLILLLSAGLLIKSFSRLQEVRPGFESENLLVVRLSLPRTRYANRDALISFYDRLLPSLESLPGVSEVGAVSALPLGGVRASIPFMIEGRMSPQNEAWRSDYRVASTGYFRAMKIPLLRGREFTEQDNAHTTPVAIISETLARRFWPDENPVGARVLVDDNNQGPRPVEIVGVVGDVKHLSLEDEPTPHIYLPLRQLHEDGVVWMTNNQYWLIRSQVSPLSLASAVQREIRKADPEVPASNIKTMEQYLSASVSARRFNLWLLSVFAATALVLATVGIYGVISYSVTQRRREIGIRMALGAQRSDILLMVVGHGMLLAVTGLASGLVGALALSRLMSGLLYQVSTTDPATYILLTFFLLLVTLAACLLPARRATKVDPTVALRYE